MNANLSRQINFTREGNDLPLYRQLAYALEELITKDFKPGTYLPSENELAQKFGVNRHTIRRAMDDLVAAGFIARQQGKGCLVVNNHIEYQFDTGRFTASLDILRLKTTSKVLKSEKINCNEKIADYLKAELNDEAVLIETLRYIDNEPVSIITHFLNAKKLPGIENSYEGGSLHSHIQTEYGISLDRTNALISAVMPNHDEAFYLKSALTKPLIKIKSFNCTEGNGNDIIEVSISRSRSDRLQIKI